MSQNRSRSVWDKIWKDKDGNIVIMQMPNIWLWAWIVLLVVSVFINRGRLLNVIHWAGSASLGVWAILELLKGANYFRKALGLVVLLATIAGFLKL